MPICTDFAQSFYTDISVAQAGIEEGWWGDSTECPLSKKIRKVHHPEDTEPKLLAFLAIKLMYFFILAKNSRETNIQHHLHITQ